MIALLFAAEALRREGAQRLMLVAPYLCYMRQDAAFHEGEAISQRVIGGLIAGMRRSRDHRRCTPASHADIRAVFPGIDSDNLSAMPPIAETLRKTGLDPTTSSSGRIFFFFFFFFFF